MCIGSQISYFFKKKKNNNDKDNDKDNDSDNDNDNDNDSDNDNDNDNDNNNKDNRHSNKVFHIHSVTTCCDQQTDRFEISLLTRNGTRSLKIGLNKER